MNITQLSERRIKMNKASTIWLSKQMEKDKAKRLEKKNNTQDNINKLIIKENKKMDKRKKITVAIDAGKGYTKWAYEKTVVFKKKEGDEIVEVSKKIWKTGVEVSSVAIGEAAEIGNTTFITIDGEEKQYNFFGTTKVVNTTDKTKDNEAHKALMLRTLFKIALEEDITDFDVIMCMSLDQYKVKENKEKMQENMHVKEFTIKEMVKDKDTKEEVEKELTIKIHDLVIEPESLVTTRFAKNTKFKDVNAILIDIGTLNVGIAPIEEGRVNVQDITAPTLGYAYMLKKLKEYTDSCKIDYPVKMLDIYIRKEQGTDKDLDKLIMDFVKNKYSTELKEQIDEKGFGKYASLVFLGGTSKDLEKYIKESFTEYKSVEIITDIHATVKGAYMKGLKDLKLLKETKEKEAELQK